MPQSIHPLPIEKGARLFVCSVCHQPECPESLAGERLPPGLIPSKLEPGNRLSRGYGEWVVHPDEAQHILHRGYVLVDGEPRKAFFIHNEAYVTQIKVEGTKTNMNVFDVAA